jgi:hypothetical protein
MYVSIITAAVTVVVTVGTFAFSVATTKRQDAKLLRSRARDTAKVRSSMAPMSELDVSSKGGYSTNFV